LAIATHLSHLVRRYGILLLLPLVTSACGLPGLPSQNDPTCSWTSAIPANHDRVCKTTFETLSALVRADVRGDWATIHRLVPTASVAHKIVVFGQQERAQRIIYLHVVPTLTLGAVRGGLLGVGFNITGKTHEGNVQAPQSLYLRLRRGRALVVQDQPDQEW
jgi:hypothetical protein